MHEELIDTQFAFYVIITIVDVIAFVCCVLLANRPNRTFYRIGLVILSFGLIFQVIRSSFFFAKIDLPYWLSMTWGLKDIGICMALVAVVVLHFKVLHNPDK